MYLLTGKWYNMEKCKFNLVGVVEKDGGDVRTKVVLTWNETTGGRMR